ncbi:MAG TPA: radical SAM family heme chaperone HemW [Burkholderiales bacterium]|nr:radical SAM family heme chaperone HemW [Burkholderiales bacterium]
MGSEIREHQHSGVRVYSSPITPHDSSHLRTLPPLALYIHIPWCVKKCPYCDFNSHEAHGTVPQQEYVEALVADVESALPQVWGRRVHSVFFGGGTPSIFQAESIDAILTSVRALLPVDSYAEITLEANPGTFEAEKFAAYRSAGINRLSIGIQSFNPRHLKALGRIHDEKEAHQAIEIAQRHFDNINLDLMYALPGQTLAEAQRDIETAVTYLPQHISAYHLTIEPNTLFHRNPPQLPDDEISAEMQEMIEQTLAAHGYGHYETSAFARKGFQSRHNMNYWLFGDYLGIGAGAHSKISTPGKIIRQMRYKQPKEYMNQAAGGAPVQESHEIANRELGFEFMMNALRLIHGFPAALFEERTGLPLAQLKKQLDAVEKMGLIDRDLQRIAPTLRGQRFLNDLLQLFLP